MRVILFILFVFIVESAFSQYPPAAGLTGSTAIYKDSSIFVSWAKSCIVQRGFVDISVSHDSITTGGIEVDAIGKADNFTISLGDSGVAVTSFFPAITNGNGFDFAVFENSFDGNFLELAFVEVSSDSIHWYRFNAASLTQTDVQVTTFGLLEPTKINNLAGKYSALYGTPFDLQELSGKPYLNIDSVSFVKIIDVVGSINGSYTSFDSQGNKINDPFPTPFFTSGFDLDAIGVINERPQNVNDIEIENITVYPNPFTEKVNADINGCGFYEIVDITGKILYTASFCNYISVSTDIVENGIYFLKVSIGNKSGIAKIVKM
ncbi:MAG: T9SS type A sorting domain-containing protein [Bacteroidia bacterium]|nr:T9SS type A sorting domain-containing protein [Bacteroidia bacterium]